MMPLQRVKRRNNKSHSFRYEAKIKTESFRSLSLPLSFTLPFPLPLEILRSSKNEYVEEDKVFIIHTIQSRYDTIR